MKVLLDMKVICSCKHDIHIFNNWSGFKLRVSERNKVSVHDASIFSHAIEDGLPESRQLNSQNKVMNKLSASWHAIMQ